MRPWLRLTILVALLGLGFLTARATGVLDALGDPETRGRLLGALRDATGRWWVGPGFALVYAAGVSLAVPASILTLLGGAAFGLWRGVLWVSVGANLGANIAFLLARHLGRMPLLRLFGGRLAGFDRLTAAAGFDGLLVLRLIPAIPFTLLNFGAGLTPIRWPHYAAATLIGILPGTVVYVLFAAALLSGSAEATRAAWIRAWLAAGLLIAFTLVTRWLLRRRNSASSSPR